MQFPADPLNLAKAVRCLVLDVDGVLTDGRLYYGDNGVETKAFYTQDGAAIKMLQTAGIPVAILSGRRSAAVERRAAELGIAHAMLGSDDKSRDIRNLADHLGVSVTALAHMGDDVQDLPAFAEVGFKISVANGHPAVRNAADFVTEAAGGFGAVREACTLILLAQGLWDRALASAQ